MKMYGIDVYYLPRSIVNLDDIMNEDIASSFGAAYMIEMYLEDVNGYTGEQTVMSKFGLEIRDSSNWVVSKRRWEQFIGNHKNTFVKGRPNEGDLLWIPLTGSFHEIKFVEHEEPFYQLGNIFTYKLQCETFEFANEKFNTGIEDIDSIEDTYQFAQTLTVGEALNDTMFAMEEEVQQLVGYDQDNNPIYVYGNVGSATFTSPDSTASMQLILNNIHASDDTNRYFQVSGIGSVGTTRKLVGLTSGAEWLITEAPDVKTLPNDPGADNLEFENYGDDILDFSETNPFGEPGSLYANSAITQVIATFDSSNVTMDSDKFTMDRA